MRRQLVDRAGLYRQSITKDRVILGEGGQFCVARE
jgi:hypothetical protein